MVLPVPGIDAVRERAEKELRFRPCLWQIEITRTLLDPARRDIVSTAATGAGKTATFFLPMLYSKLATIIVTPLKLLGEQHAQEAIKLGFKAVSVMRENFTPVLQKVSSGEQHNISLMRELTICTGNTHATISCYRCEPRAPC